MGAVRGVDGLQGVDGHLVEADVDLLRLFNNNRSRRHAKEDGVLKNDPFVKSCERVIKNMAIYSSHEEFA